MNVVGKDPVSVAYCWIFFLLVYLNVLIVRK